MSTKNNSVECRNVVIYARYSTNNQTEASIEGQLKVCYEWAKRKGYRVIGEYIDRAISGSTDNRPDFQRMIRDSNNKEFQGVVVYQFDRFARNRCDSSVYKTILKKNGVRVYSAKEDVSDDPSGRMMEGMLELFAEYYCDDAAQKITRGMQLLADKCLYTGGGVAFGLKINPDKTIGLDEETAPFVLEIFERYARGENIVEICDYLNSLGLKTSRKATFNKCSLTTILKNKRYIGYYTYKDKETPNVIPRIVSDELFNEVQERLKLNKKAPARAKAKEEYLLTGKLFCGECKSPMSGVSGTSKTKRKYSYYICAETKKGKGHKSKIGKKQIEDLIFKKCKEILTNKNIQYIAKEIVKMSKRAQKRPEFVRLNNLKKEIENAIKNLMDNLERNSDFSVQDMILERLKQKRIELDEVERNLYNESLKIVCAR